MCRVSWQLQRESPGCARPCKLCISILSPALHTQCRLAVTLQQLACIASDTANSHQRRSYAEAMMPVMQHNVNCKNLQLYPGVGGHTCLLMQSWQARADWLKLAAARRVAGRQCTGSRGGGQQSAQDC